MYGYCQIYKCWKEIEISPTPPLHRATIPSGELWQWQQDKVWSEKTWSNFKQCTATAAKRLKVDLTLVKDHQETINDQWCQKEVKPQTVHWNYSKFFCQQHLMKGLIMSKTINDSHVKKRSIEEVKIGTKTERSKCQSVKEQQTLNHQWFKCHSTSWSQWPGTSLTPSG